MLMQSYDFLVLNRKYGCQLELGGDDQWSNIIGGVELIRKADDKEAYGMTFTLLTTSDGRKMGKTESGAVWLDPEKPAPMIFISIGENVDDADVYSLFKRFLTFLPLEEIEAMAKWEGSQLNKAKEILAFEVTKLIHGEEEAVKAQNAARAILAAVLTLRTCLPPSFPMETLPTAKSRCWIFWRKQSWFPRREKPAG